ncbi:hypothetical protein GCM10023185_19990 [Hymenobacter saemangeumensis]|uniref:Cellulase n=1 Tax=Hymenobacter saemangeumensis TaxID=1084522 RepID=A0ABP8ICS4_9BACT
MKQLFLCLALLCAAGSAGAQTLTGADSLRQQLAYIFAPLDKSQVPTGCLANYAVPLAANNGTLVDSNRSDNSVWRLAYATLMMSQRYQP